MPATCSVLSCRLLDSGSQYQATTGTYRQNILFFQSKRHCLCLSVSLPVANVNSSMWKPYKNVLSCRAVPYNVNRP